MRRIDALVAGRSTQPHSTLRRVRWTSVHEEDSIEFEGTVVDATALARAVGYVFEASRVDGGSTYIEGFLMNPSDKWSSGDPRITIVQK